MPLSHKTHPLITGTLLLTAAGLLSRVLGFFYRIFLSRTIGAEGLGIYQMIFPVYGIFFSLCAGSIQTAISRFTAADPDHAKRTLLSGFSLSFAMSLAAAFVIRHFSGPLAEHVLMEPRCAPLLSVMARFRVPLSMPASAGTITEKKKSPSLRPPSFLSRQSGSLRYFCWCLSASKNGFRSPCHLPYSGWLPGKPDRRCLC